MLPLLPNDAVSVQRERSDTVADASRAPQPEEGRAPEAPHDGAPPAMFLDRDHSILAFNERVFDWAVSKRGFGLTPTDAAEHVLQITGTNVQPDLADHIGSFVDKRCVVSLSLVPKIRNEG